MRRAVAKARECLCVEKARGIRVPEPVIRQTSVRSMMREADSAPVPTGAARRLPTVTAAPTSKAGFIVLKLLPPAAGRRDEQLCLSAGVVDRGEDERLTPFQR